MTGLSDKDRGPKLTTEQQSMLVACYDHNLAWVTAPDGPNHDLLRGFEAAGVFEEIKPSPHPPLVAYQITPAGRTALATFNEALDEWGCTDPAKRAEAIADFIAGGCQLWEYEVRDVAEVVGHA